MTPAEALANSIFAAISDFRDLNRPYHVILAKLAVAIQEYEESKWNELI